MALPCIQQLSETVWGIKEQLYNKYENIHFRGKLAGRVLSSPTWLYCLGYWYSTCHCCQRAVSQDAHSTVESWECPASLMLLPGLAAGVINICPQEVIFWPVLIKNSDRNRQNFNVFFLGGHEMPLQKTSQLTTNSLYTMKIPSDKST